LSTAFPSHMWCADQAALSAWAVSSVAWCLRICRHFNRLESVRLKNDARVLAEEFVDATRSVPVPDP